MQCSSWDREDLSRMTMVFVPHPLFGSGVQMELVVHDQDVWQLLIGETKLEIVHAFKGDRRVGYLDLEKSAEDNRKALKPIMDFVTVFNGCLGTADELITVLRQVGCPVK